MWSLNFFFGPLKRPKLRTSQSSLRLYQLRGQWIIKRWGEAMGAALVGSNFSPIPSKISFHMKIKSDSLQPEIYKALKPCWFLNWVSVAKVVARFPQASRLLPAATALAQSRQPTRKRLVFVLACRTSARRAGELLQELSFDFAL